MTLNLFPKNEQIPIITDAFLLKGFANPYEKAILKELPLLLEQAPFRHMITPNGHQMSLAMTSCGEYGWITDRKGYRYDSKDPLSQKIWPKMPEAFFKLATEAALAADFENFVPNSCLINLYQIGTKLSLHQDKDEHDLDSPVVSVSLGLPAMFIFGGKKRTDSKIRVPLSHNDVVVWGRTARLNYHAILPIKPGKHLLLGEKRINLTFRRVVL